MRIPTPEQLDEDEVEIEVTPAAHARPATPVRMRTAAGTAPQRNPRQHHNPADDVIESGEIVERRSLVIRSSQPAISEWSEPTEVTATAFPAATPARRSGRVLWLVAGIAAGIAAGVLMVRATSRAPSSTALEARAQMVGTLLDGEARAAMVRAQAIAASPVLRAGIETDAATLADMARDHDLVFPLQAGDVIEVSQRRAGARALLLRLPEGARVLAPPAAGQVRIEAHARGVVVVAATPVTNDRAVPTGDLVLAVPVDLSPIAEGLSDEARGVVLEGLGEPVVLRAGGAATNLRIPVRTRTPAAGSLALAASVRPPAATSDLYAWACAVLSALFLGTFAVSVVRARRHVAVPAG